MCYLELGVFTARAVCDKILALPREMHLFNFRRLWVPGKATSQNVLKRKISLFSVQLCTFFSAFFPFSFFTLLFSSLFSLSQNFNSSISSKKIITSYKSWFTENPCFGNYYCSSNTSLFLLLWRPKRRIDATSSSQNLSYHIVYQWITSAFYTSSEKRISPR